VLAGYRNRVQCQLGVRYFVAVLKACPLKSTAKLPNLRACRVRVSIAKIKNAFEMNTIRRDRVTCYTDEFQALSEF
jgi:RNase P protein component